MLWLADVGCARLCMCAHVSMHECMYVITWECVGVCTLRYTRMNASVCACAFCVWTHGAAWLFWAGRSRILKVAMDVSEEEVAKGDGGGV